MKVIRKRVGKTKIERIISQQILLASNPLMSGLKEQEEENGTNI
jgi:hypothetical protein